MKKPKYVPKKVTKRGSQTCEPIELTNYAVSSKNGNELILRDTTDGMLSKWVHNQDHSGYVVQVGRKNYEFVTSVCPVCGGDHHSAQHDPA